jgi:hypothetical protein
MPMATKKTPAKAKNVKKTAPRKVVKATPAPEFASQKVLSDVEEIQWHAKLEAYAALQSAKVPIPPDLASEVESKLQEIEAQKIAQQKAEQEEKEEILKANKTGPTWVRNCYRSEFSLRLERQEDKKRIELKPRGQRGDLFPLQPGDEFDQILVANLHTGLIELIPDGEAKIILSKQTNNLQRFHTPLAILTNEYGENKGEMKLNVAEEYNKQGVVVGIVPPQDPRGGSNVPKGPLGIARPGEQLHFVPTGGHPHSVQVGPISPEAQAKMADTIARIKGNQGRPEDVLGLSVTVDPVQKV